MAVDRLLEQWIALRSHFDSLSVEEPAFHAMSSLYRTPIYLLYMKFLSYALTMVTAVNKEFQAERPVLHLLHTRMTSFFKTLLSNYMKKDYLASTPIHMIVPNNPSQYKSNLEEVFAGPKAELELTTMELPNADKIDFRQRILRYYIELCRQIK